MKKEIIETELGCSLSETFGIESDKIPNMDGFILTLNKENIVHTIKNKNDGKQVIFFANRNKEKVINIFQRCFEKEKQTSISHDNNQNKSVKKHHSR